MADEVFLKSVDLFCDTHSRCYKMGMARDGKCPCLSQTDDSVVWCQLDDGHEGLHRWQDPVHPGHSKAWGGNVTDVVTDTRHRFESWRNLAERCGVFERDGSGRARYAPMSSADEGDYEFEPVPQ